LFSSSTGLAIHRIHNKPNWFIIIQLMLGDTFYLRRDLGEKLGMNHKTAFQWCHIILYAIQAETKSFNGIVEIDDLHYRFSEKRRHGLDSPKKRSSDFNKKGDSDESVNLYLLLIVLAHCN